MGGDGRVEFSRLSTGGRATEKWCSRGDVDCPCVSSLGFQHATVAILWLPFSCFCSLSFQLLLLIFFCSQFCYLIIMNISESESETVTVSAVPFMFDCTSNKLLRQRTEAQTEDIVFQCAAGCFCRDTENPISYFKYQDQCTHKIHQM